MMYGPMVPPSRPRNQSPELRQYAANEWRSNPYLLVLEAERLAEEKRKGIKPKERGRTSFFKKFLTSLLKRMSKKQHESESESFMVRQGRE